MNIGSEKQRDHDEKVVEIEMIREINVSEITAAVKEMCIQANHFLSPDMDKALKAATNRN